MYPHCLNASWHRQWGQKCLDDFCHLLITLANNLVPEHWSQSGSEPFDNLNMLFEKKVNLDKKSTDGNRYIKITEHVKKYRYYYYLI